MNDKINELFDIKDIINDIKRKDTPQRYCLFIIGMYISALNFNLFFSKYNIVTGGSAGLSIIFKYLYDFDQSKFVLYISLALLVLSFFLLGVKSTLRSTVGTILYPLFIKITTYPASFINIESDSFLILMIYGGLLSGLSLGMIMKTGFTTGGFNILYQIMNKYFNFSIGKASLVVNSIIIIFGALIFGIPNGIYAVIALYISSFIADRIILGISHSKTFYIITDKEDEVKHYILEKLCHGVTVVNVKGGQYNNKKKMLMCVVPTKEYFSLKEVVLQIDKDAFFLITDSYEVAGAI